MMTTTLYVLLPLSVLFVLGIGAALCWAVLGGQYDATDKEGAAILEDDDTGADSGARADAADS
jgi:cbb3-type cytochrome oxidase maturation protein